MTDPRIFRYEVPVDDQWHAIPLGGHVLAVAARTPELVEFWALTPGGEHPEPRWFRVVGTGQPLPNSAKWTHRGTTLAAGGQLVWHLIETRPTNRKPGDADA